MWAVAAVRERYDCVGVVGETWDGHTDLLGRHFELGPWKHLQFRRAVPLELVCED